ncbi:MAG: hypothetical protein LBF80_01130 [Spirochaetaceae bacterium]|jgi:nitrogen fixation protein NifB|nr:hypothetical protein [Spirochaetaceae bacterium]
MSPVLAQLKCPLDINPPSPELTANLRRDAGKYLRQMSHCGRCRADAAGFVGDPNKVDFEKLLEEAVTAKPRAERPYIAAASMEGLFVNRHLGESLS